MAVNDSGLETIRKAALEVSGSDPKTEYQLRVVNPDGSDIGAGGGTSIVADTTYNEGTLAITSASETLAAVTGTNQASRKYLVITNLTTGRIFYGKTGFTASTTTAPSLSQRQSVTLAIGPSLSIFLRRASGSGTAHIQELS